MRGNVDWRDATLLALLKSTTPASEGRSSSHPRPGPSEAVVSRPGKSPSDFVLEKLGANNLLTSMHALVPRATDAALALLDDAIRSASRADMFDERGIPLDNPRVLGLAVKCIFAKDDGRCIVKVRSSRSVSYGSSTRDNRQNDHLVFITGVCLSSGPDEAFFISPQDDNFSTALVCRATDEDITLPLFSCDCRAFEFLSGNEVHCKHIIAAALAIASNLASHSIVNDEDFVRILERSWL